MLAQIIATDTIRLVPGRLRIAIEGLRRNPVLAEYIVCHLSKTTGIKSAAANPQTGRALVHFNPQIITLAEIENQIKQARQQFARKQQSNQVGIDGVSSGHDSISQQADECCKSTAAATVPAMHAFNTVVTGGILAGLVAKRLVMGRSMLSSSQQIFNLAAITTIVSGYPVLRRGLEHLVKTNKVNHDLLISIVTLILLAMRESITGLSVLWLVNLSGLFNYVMQVRSRKAVQRLLEGKNKEVIRVQGGHHETVAVNELAVGDVIVVGRGDNVPVDGEVIAGKATVNQAAICGECLPADKRSGDDIFAGTLVTAGAIKIKAHRVGANTSLARIVELVRKATNEADVVEAGEQYSGKLVPWAIGIAAVIFFLTRDYRRSLAVLLAGCPAAVALSSYTALGMGITQAARQGIYVKNAGQFETAGQADIVLFDKTGTLTLAKPEVTEWVILDNKLNEDDMVQLVASSEKATSHPLARMLVEEAHARNIELIPARGRIVLGYGVKAEVGEKHVLVGSKKLMTEEKVDLRRGVARAGRLEHLGSSVIYVAVNKKLVGLIGLKDRLRPESQAAVEAIRLAGIEQIGLITGDNVYTAESVSAELGLTQKWGAMMPEDKVAVIRSLKNQGHNLIMVGDGINDSPALSAANVGIAMGEAGAAMAIESAGIVMADDNPQKVADTIELSRLTTKVLRQNLAFSAGLNVVGIGLAAMRLISPVTAALLQNISTLGVLFNSVRLLKNRNNSSSVMTGSQNGTMIDDDKQLDLQRFADQVDNVVFMRVPEYNGSKAGAYTAVQDGGWHSMSAEQVCKVLDTSAHFGLSEYTCRTRLGEYGVNALTEAPKPTFWEMFKNQFKDFMVQVLIGAAGLSFALGKAKDAALTVAIVIANALLGVAQERKAEKSIGALQQLAAPLAKVIRRGRVQKIKAENLVPGDMIVLEAGDRVPADARLISASHFEVEEASLTGETVPVKKNCMLIGDKDMPLADRKNLVFMGTNVTRGRAHAVVVATGMSTEMGKIATMIQYTGIEQTPLQKKLEEIGKFLVYGCLAVSGLVMAAGLLRGEPLLHMLQTAASLAVAAIPEGLSAIVIIALAMGVQRMSKRNVIVRRMSSIETLGCATVICSDKTGTLTKNEMTVRKIYAGDKLWSVSGEGYVPRGKFSHGNVTLVNVTEPALTQALLAAALCNNAKLVKQQAEEGGTADEKRSDWDIQGDPTEGALLVAAAKAGIWPDSLQQSYIRVKEIPFESERRMMSVIYSGHSNAKTLFCKGACDNVLAACNYYLSDGQVVPLSDSIRTNIQNACEQMAGEALRVLAVAYRELTEQEFQQEGDYEQNMIFAGLAGMIDPPRPEVPAAIAKCRQAGVKVVMITGDHPKTAKAIASELGLFCEGDLILTGQELERLSDKQLASYVDLAAVYARTAPQHKLRIIKALKQKGYVVAMTGDGVNDAPAVKAADIGIAMGVTGTDVTKEAAGMTLADDNFATIVNAMEEGRSIYANIRKAIRYLLATNIGEVILMFLAALLGLPMPLLPIQLLWINLIGDGLPAIALVNDPPAKDIMQQKPSSAKDSVFSGGLGRKIISRGLVIGGVSLAAFAWKFMRTSNVVLARTFVLVQVALSQFIHLFDCRLEKKTGKVGLFSNSALVGATMLSLAMVAGIVHIPALNAIFGTMPLGTADWLFAAAAAVVTATLDFSLDSILSRWLPDRTEPLEPCEPAPMPEV